MHYLIILALLTCSALFSGLTLGLMSLNVFELKRKLELGDKFALAIYPLRKRGNELLTALLLGNVAVNSILAIFLGSITSGVIAGIIATSLIFLFGEILPQAVISRHAMKFGSLTAPLVRVLLLITYPIAKPIGLILDKILGDELPTIFSKSELAMLVAEHEDNPNAAIDTDEERIIHGALRFSDTIAQEIMTPKSVVFMLDESVKISSELLLKLKDEGYSRIPLFQTNRDKITGFVHVRNLLGAETGTLRDYAHEIIVIPATMKLDVLKNILLSKHHHMAVLTNEYGTFVGLVTLEDILEEVIGREILDEDDDVADMQEYAKQQHKARKYLGS